MSYNETKIVLRAEIKEMKGYSYTQAYTYFRDRGFPEADDIDGNENEVEWFTYEEKIGEVRPVYDYDQIRWGLELILGLSDDYSGSHYVSFSLDELKEKVDLLKEKYFELDWKIYSYTWYNGSDEPIDF